MKMKYLSESVLKLNRFNYKKLADIFLGSVLAVSLRG